MGVQLKLKTMEIYTQYQTLREAGATMEDAIRKLQPDVTPLPETSREKLKQLVLDWEKAHVDTSAPAPEPPASPARADPAPPQRIRPIRMEATVACPVCGRLNRKGDDLCSKCGYDLSMATPFGTKKFARANGGAQLAMSTNHLGEHTAILLNIRGASEPLLIVPRGDMTIGRVAQGSSAYPDIDLSLYQAELLGVSRLHVMLKREAHTLVMIDLNSRNHTYINGQRLFPNERRVLRDGDQVRLGDLVMQVIFKD